MQNRRAGHCGVTLNAAVASEHDQHLSTIAEILKGQVHAAQDDLIARIARQFTPIVSHAFPDQYQALYLLTENSRRQVWHACFAAESSTGFASLLDQEPAALRHALTRMSNERLLQQAYGTVPMGFIKLLGKLGATANRSSCYIALHKLLTDDPCCNRPLSQLNRIDERMVKIVEGLGARFALPNILPHLHGGTDARAVGTALQDFIDHGLVGEHDLIERLKRVERGRHLSQLIDRIYASTPFPPPPIPACPQCRPIETSGDLKDVARRYRNCVSTFIHDVVRGEAFFYEWLGDEPAVIHLAAERPFGWRIETMAGMQNSTPSHECRDAILLHFKQAGVHARPSIERIVRGLSEDDDIDAELEALGEELEEVTGRD